MFDFLKPKATIVIAKGRYDTPKWGYEQGGVMDGWHELFRTGWITGDARAECELWCEAHGYRYDKEEA